ncbi:MAG: ABC transporter substrate-binding protein [Flavonifractor plautii]
MCTSGGFNVLGNDGRCSIIGREIGFENIGVDADIDTSTHGNEASFEFVVEKNPDYIFVMDRDAAIQTDGAQLAQEIMENELVMGTDAYKNGNIVYLAHPAVWYTAEGGITALDIMLQDLESKFAGLSPANNRKGRDTHGYPALSSSSLPAAPCYNGLS